MLNRGHIKQYLVPIGFGVFFLASFQVMLSLLNGGDIFSYFALASALLIISLLMTGFTFIIQSRPKVDLIPYLIHPVFLLLGVSGFLIFNEEVILREAVIVFASLSYYMLFSESFSDLAHHAHDGVKFFIIFILYDSVFEGVYYLGLIPYVIIALIFALTFMFQGHMLWRLRALKRNYITLALVNSVVLAVATWILMDVYNLSSYLPLSIMVLSIYYLFWGVIHHMIEKTLTLRTFFEYFFVCIMVLIMFFGLSSGF